MKITWIVLLLVAGLISCTDEIVITETEISSDLFYTENNLIPFSGKCKVVFNSNQAVKEILTYRKGRLDGTAQYYYHNGNLKRKGFYEDGYITGKWQYWDENGRLMYVVNYKYDTLDGEFVSYYPNGGLKEQGHYLDNSRTGEWTLYSENGKITGKKFYN
jgi:antitoxin component YwqK of YwqJK toxin-antitoxin module